MCKHHHKCGSERLVEVFDRASYSSRLVLGPVCTQLGSILTCPQPIPSVGRPGLQCRRAALGGRAGSIAGSGGRRRDNRHWADPWHSQSGCGRLDGGWHVIRQGRRPSPIPAHRRSTSGARTVRPRNERHESMSMNSIGCVAFVPQSVHLGAHQSRCTGGRRHTSSRCVGLILWVIDSS